MTAIRGEGVRTDMVDPAHILMHFTGFANSHTIRVRGTVYLPAAMSSCRNPSAADALATLFTLSPETATVAMRSFTLTTTWYHRPSLMSGLDRTTVVPNPREKTSSKRPPRRLRARKSSPKSRSAGSDKEIRRM